ncbi:MAG: ABC transporter ATP-binding protein [Ignavibacteriae bacterium]|nr:ABC transporter ATP-binding protein [Ignavibacteriota bacterium]
MNSVIIENISKSYGDVLAVDDVSLTIEKGEIFGFIGPDGAGKTSLFRMLTTLLIPDKGNATVEGFDIVKDYKKIRSAVGYMPGRFSLYQDLTVEENLHFFAAVFGTTIQENYNLIKDIYVMLEPFKNRKAGKLSGGMKQKLALCCALIHKPKILFLDEPTTGVDPVSRNEFWDMLGNLRKEGITIVVSTPYMDEANKCDRIALMQKGKIMETDYLKNIISRFPRKLFAVKSDGMFVLLNELREYQFANSVFSFGDSLHYSDSRENVTKDNILEYLNTKNHGNISIEEIEPNIEDCFMDLMSK